jgi:hypothetical protein
MQGELSPKQHRFVQSLIARIVLATRLVDYGCRVFHELRSRIILACAPDAFYDTYNELTYARQKSYRAGTKTFRSNLLPFEEQAISRHFPLPPGTLLVGAAGGGREALALARQGYRVVAFDPAQPLVISLAGVCGDLPVESLLGRYEDLPVVNSLSHPPVTIDLRSRTPFAAAILGFGSISHLRSDQRCIKTLRQFGQLTPGPILVSWQAPFEGRSSQKFDVYLGYVRSFTGMEIRKLAEDAGLEVVHLDDENYWHAVLRASTTTMVARPDLVGSTVADG